MDPSRILDCDEREYFAFTRGNPNHYKMLEVRCSGSEGDPRHALSTKIPDGAVAVYGFRVVRDEHGYEATATALFPREFKKDLMPPPHFG